MSRILSGDVVYAYPVDACSPTIPDSNAAGYGYSGIFNPLLFTASDIIDPVSNQGKAGVAGCGGVPLHASTAADYAFGTRRAGSAENHAGGRPPHDLSKGDILECERVDWSDGNAANHAGIGIQRGACIRHPGAALHASSNYQYPDPKLPAQVTSFSQDASDLMDVWTQAMQKLTEIFNQAFSQISSGGGLDMASLFQAGSNPVSTGGVTRLTGPVASPAAPLSTAASTLPPALKSADISGPVASGPLDVGPGVKPGTFSEFFVNRDQRLDGYIAQLRTTDPAAAQKLQLLADLSVSKWMTGQSNDEQVLREYVQRANAAGKEGLVTLYNINGRDLGHYSKGGVSSDSEYKAYTQRMSNAIGDGKVTIYLEPDSLMHSARMSTADGHARRQLLGETVAMFKAENKNATILLNGGAAGWGTPEEVANLLMDANIRQADGFYLNGSDYKSTAASMAWGDAIVKGLEAAGVTGKVYDIDTSRNGATINATGEAAWADAYGAAAGHPPTKDQAVIQNANVRALTYIKTPWQGDGRLTKAGDFAADYAIKLVENAFKVGSWTS